MISEETTVSNIKKITKNSSGFIEMIDGCGDIHTLTPNDYSFLLSFSGDIDKIDSANEFKLVSIKRHVINNNHEFTYQLMNKNSEALAEVVFYQNALTSTKIPSANSLIEDMGHKDTFVLSIEEFSSFSREEILSALYEKTYNEKEPITIKKINVRKMRDLRNELDEAMNQTNDDDRYHMIKQAIDNITDGTYNLKNFVSALGSFLFDNAENCSRRLCTMRPYMSEQYLSSFDEFLRELLLKFVKENNTKMITALFERNMLDIKDVIDLTKQATLIDVMNKESTA